MACPVVPDIPGSAGCGDNIPGVKTVHVIEMGGVVTPLPAPGAGTRTITTDVALSGLDPFASWTFIQENAVHTETPNDSGQYDTLLTLIFPKDDDVKRHNFNEMHNPCCKYLVIYTDNNDVTKIIPDLNFRDSYTTGQGESTERNQYTAEFYKTGAKAYIYEGIIPTPV